MTASDDVILQRLDNLTAIVTRLVDMMEPLVGASSKYAEDVKRHEKYKAAIEADPRFPGLYQRVLGLSVVNDPVANKVFAAADPVAVTHYIVSKPDILKKLNGMSEAELAEEFPRIERRVTMLSDQNS